MHSEADQLPIESDFLDPRSRDPDERHAVKMFLGKTSEQAEEMFRQCFLVYQEDLTYMRAAAFRFYLIPAIRYLLSNAADGDSDAASTLCYVLESRLEYDPDALTPLLLVIREAIQGILRDFERYKCSPAIYGDVPSRYRKLAHRLDA